jgi:hypothetical protein
MRHKKEAVMFTTFRALVASVAVLVSASSVQSQDFYLGLGYDMAKPHSGAESSGVALLAGAQFGQGALTYGPELDLSMLNGDFDATRLRGVVHNDLGRFGLFGSLGLTQYSLDAGGSTNGFNYGLGADYAITDSLDLRIEAVRDFMPDYTTNVTTIRAGVTFGF